MPALPVRFLALALLATPPAFHAQEPGSSAISTPGLADLVSQVRPSLVTISHEDRSGRSAGTGSGFVLSTDGLVATCYHVIGEARKISVTASDGTVLPVTAIHAFDRKLDLAVLQVAPAGADLKPLGLAEPDTALTQGQRIAAMGNPQGLDYSIVEGVVSAVRTFELSALYGPMIQLTIPIEPGNSGGPLLDLSGNVHGILSVKSLVTENLGFATPSAALRPLIEKPNPVPYDKWLTIGAIDPRRWTPVMGSDWHQRAGRVLAGDPGTGFGGRTLLLWHQQPDKPTYELSVSVKLDDEAGAAGLVFAADGGDVHYGFYPSGGALRFTRFEGPSVFSWTILEQIDSPDYRPGDWNDLRVRVSPEGVTGFVNGQKVLESTDTDLRGGRVGLAKFRDTVAEFRNFRLGHDLATPRPSPADLRKLRSAVRGLPRDAAPDADTAALLSATPHLADTLINERAEALEARARALRELASDLHTAHTAQQIVQLTDPAATDLATPALLIAQLDDIDLEPTPYIDELDRLADELKERIAAGPDTGALEHLNTLLFTDNGYHGSRHDYYNAANSYLNQVVDDREGIPISLSVLYLEVARRAGVPDLVGLGLPGHFIVAEQADPTEPYTRYIDVFERGKFLSETEADAIVTSYGGTSGRATDYHPATVRDIASRMLYNLKSIAIEDEDWPAARRYTEVLVSLSPDDAQERLSRAILNLQSGRRAKATPDLEWILDQQPPGIDLGRIREFLDATREQR